MIFYSTANFKTHNLFVIPSLLLVIACNSGSDVATSGIDEGIITYEIAFPNIEPNTLLASVLPSEIKTFFKRSKVRTDMSFGMGKMELMRTVTVADSKTQEAYFCSSSLATIMLPIII